jgi:Phosphodiester glycosidase
VPRRSPAIVLIFLAALSAPAAWIERDSRSESSSAPGLVHRHVVLEDSDNGASANLELALFSPRSCQLRVIDNPDGRSSLAEAIPAAKCLAGVNGGYFDPNFAPLGLRVMDGKMTARLVRSRLLSGVLIFSGNSVQIVRAGGFSKKLKPSAAVECGPFLVDRGRRVAGLEATRAARRTFAAIGSGDRVALGYCSEVTLAKLSDILAGGVGDFKVQRALNLDGGSSSAFWFKGKDGSMFSIPEQKTVRDFVGVSAR